MKSRIKTLVTILCLASGGCGKHVATNTANSAEQAPVEKVAECSIAGGAGLQLEPASPLAQGECSSRCQAHSADHPNLSCAWGAINLARVGTCLIDGPDGVALASLTVSRGQCYDHCRVLSQITPNSLCLFNGIDVGLAGNCSIVGGAGRQLLLATESQGACALDFASLLVTRPNAKATFNGAAM